MSHVTAVLEGHEGAERNSLVRTSASALASRLGIEVEVSEIREGDRPHRIAAVTDALERPDVAAGALSVDAPDGICWEVLAQVSPPLVVVPRLAGSAPSSLARVLVPLDGREETAECVCGIADQLVAGGVELIAMHVFVADTVPRFWDQAAHAATQWSTEFLRRNLPAAADLGLRRGDPTEEVLAEASASHADLLLLGWSQDLGAGRARLVREVLTRGTVPVLLVPTAPRRAA